MASAGDKSFLLETLDNTNNKALRNGGYVELEKLSELSITIDAFLNEVAHKQIRYPAVKNWVERLRDAAYDVDDLLDEIATDDAQAQHKSLSFLTVNILNILCDSCGKEIVMTMFKGIIMKHKINLIVGKIEQLEKEARLLLGLIANTLSQPPDRPETSSLVDESIVYGRENDQEAIIKLLLSQDVSADGGISVIPIVGMAGLGKTTLAQLAFNNPIVKERFDLRVWVCVGSHFDICKVTRTILEAVTPHKSESKDLNLLQIRLKESLEGKKFLLVLDDVWIQIYDDWMTFRTPLSVGAKGSKIIATTRSSVVAHMVSIMPPYHLGFLNDEDCWFVLAKHAFGNESPSSYPHPKAIGQRIARKCCGLPLAACVLGSLLRSKQSVREWEAVLNKNILTLETETASRILPVVRLSYYHLPKHLRRCFAYCSIFPRGYEFDKEKLILLWMAEGFLQQIKGERKEDAGDRYFLELISASFFQKSSANFAMHDLMTELAQLVAGEFFFKLEDGHELPYAISKKLRHLSFARGEIDSSEKLRCIFKAPRLRTFLPINSPTVDHKSCHLSNDVLQDLLVRLPCLRVLSLAFYDISKLPYSLGKLKHLRYLDLSHTPLKILPESVCSLYNLQTLNLSNCGCLSKLPEGMRELINLRHLFIKETDVQWMPLGMGRLTNLQTLSNFIVGKEGSSINELSKLSNLRGALSISGLQSFDAYEDASDGKLKGMRFLDELELGWSSKSYDPVQDEKVLESLVPPDDLKRLKIESYGGNGFPEWLGVSSFYKIVFLRLSNCVNCSCLPTLGQLPSLEVLVIEGLDQVRRIDQEFYGMNSSFNRPFQSLKILKFDRMLYWEVWRTLEAEDGEFHCLLELYITNCPGLRMSLPKRLPSLMKLVISECPRLSYPVCLPVTSAQCNVLIDGKKVQPRISEYEDTLSVSSYTFEISSLAEQTPSPSAFDSFADDVASESPHRMTVTADITHQAGDQAWEFNFPSSSSKPSDDAELEKFPGGFGISILPQEVASQMTSDGTKQDVVSQSVLIMSNTTSITHQADDQAKTFDSSHGSSKYSDVTTEISSLPQKVSSQTTLANATIHDAASQYALPAIKTTAFAHQVDDQAKQFHNSPGSSKHTDATHLGKLPRVTEISILPQEIASQTASHSTIHDVASQSTTHMSRTTEITDQVDQAKAFDSSPSSSKHSDVLKSEKLQPEIEIPPALRISKDGATTHKANDQVKAFYSSPSTSKHADNMQLEKSPLTIEIPVPKQVDSQTTIDITTQDVALQSALHMSRPIATTHQTDDQSKAFQSSPGSSEHSDATQLENSPHDVALKSSSYKPGTTDSARNAEDEDAHSLSQDEMQLQDSSPRTWKVSDIAQLTKLPIGLQSLRIEGCDTLDSLPKEILSNNPFLQHLYVIDCGSLVSFPVGDDSKAPALKTLHIRNCRELQFSLSSDMKCQFPLLEHLCIESSCDSLTSFPLSYFPGLRILCLADCINLQSIPIEEGLSDKKLHSLEALEIRDCPNLGQKSFPQGLPASNLSSIFFSNCKSLQSLPIQQGCQKSLRSLFISKCPELESLALDGLPTSLNLLCITSCNKIKITEELGLKQLKALRHFEIEGGCVDMTSFPKKGLLPENLVSLHISKLMNLKFLDQEGLQELVSLEKLEINCCKRLRSLPVELPSSLSTLSIKDCPLLKAKLQNKKGTDWSRIADIPNIYIDEKGSY